MAAAGRGEEQPIDPRMQASGSVRRGEERGHEWWPAQPRPRPAGAPPDILRFFDEAPGGPCVLSAAFEGARNAAIVRWVQPCATAPPMISIAVGRGLAVAALIHGSRRFALARVRHGDRLLQRRLEAHGREEDPFLGLSTITTPGGCPVPTRALRYLDCELAFILDLEADFGLHIGVITGGDVLTVPQGPEAFIQ